MSLPFYTHSFNSSEKGVSPVSAAAAIRQSYVFPAPTADGGAGSSPSLGVDTVTVSPRRPYIPLLQSFLKLYVLAVLWRPFEFAVQAAIFVFYFLFFLCRPAWPVLCNISQLYHISPQCDYFI